jgi:HEAT repeat protein/CHAT domain-containing protein
MGNERAVEPLLPVLRDPDSQVRSSASWALGSLEDRRAVGPLIGALQDEDQRVRRTAARSLNVIRDSRAVGPLIAALTDADRDVRGWAAKALGALRDTRAVEPLIAAAKDETGSVRASADEALGKIGDVRAVAPLIDALGDAEASVRAAAVEALGEVGDDRAVEPLLPVLTDPDRGVRSNACWVLGNLGDGRAVKPLIATLADAEASVRARAAKALGKIKDTRALKPLVAAVNDKDESVRRGAAAALVGIRQPAVRPLLVALKEAKGPERILAVEALGKIGDGRAVQPLIALLGDPDLQARIAAAAALKEIGDRRAVEPLIALLSDPESEVRIAAAEALGRIGEPAVGSLVTALSEANSNTREFALQALAQVGEAALEPLVAALRDEDSLVRNGARSLLGPPVEEALLSAGAHGWPLGRNEGSSGQATASSDALNREMRESAESALVRIKNGLKSSLVHLQAMRGRRHPGVARALHQLSVLEAATGNPERALKYARRARDIEEYNFCFVLIAGSEEQKRTYAEWLRASVSATVSLHTRYPSPDPEAVNLALRTVLRRKGRTLDPMTYALAALRQRLQPADRKLLDEWTALLAQESSLSRLTGEQMGSGNAEMIASLRRRRQNIEQDLRGRSGAFWQLSDLPSLEEIQGAIPEDAALVEILVYQPTTWRAQEAPRYIAYVLRREGEPRWADLGRAATIDSAAVRLLRALSRPRRRWGGSRRATARNVYERVVEPIEPFLQGVRHLFISADGMLNLVPMGALSDKKGRFLIERYPITYLTTGRDLLRLDGTGETHGSPLILAGPDFDGEGKIARAPRREALVLRAPRSADLSTFTFPPLTGAVEEGTALAKLLPKAELRLGNEATEGALKRARGPQILHIATHGFFLPDQTGPGPTAESELDEPSDQPPRPGAMRRENPLLRSGLALAGANLGTGADEDGVLTALEASGLDLWGTQLVVLSACETGMGEIRNGEGVYGLRRAMVVTGAETQVTSLWKVADEATRNLMVAYYGRLLRGEGRSQALRQVQLEMLQDAELAHPFYWASFIPVGDWRPIKLDPQAFASH